MFESILGGDRNKKCNLHFYDDDSFEFRKLPVDAACLVEKKDDMAVKGWKHFHGTELPFFGFKTKSNIGDKTITAGMYSITHDRDFICDIYNRVPVTGNPQSGKPARTDAQITEWTSQIAESQRYKVMNKPGTSLIMNRVTMFLGIGLLLLLLIFGAARACA